MSGKPEEGGAPGVGAGASTTPAPEPPGRSKAEEGLLREIQELRAKNRDAEARMVRMEEAMQGLTTTRQSMADAAVADIASLQSSFSQQLEAQRAAFEAAMGKQQSELAELSAKQFNTAFENEALKRRLLPKYKEFALAKIKAGGTFDSLAEEFGEWFEVAPELGTRSAAVAGRGDIDDKPVVTDMMREVVSKLSPRFRKYITPEGLAASEKAMREKRELQERARRGRLTGGDNE